MTTFKIKVKEVKSKEYITEEVDYDLDKILDIWKGAEDELLPQLAIKLDEAVREIDRLRGVVDRGATAWLSLDPGVPWAGDLGDAMSAAVRQIAELRRERERDEALDKLEALLRKSWSAGWKACNSEDGSTRKDADIAAFLAQSKEEA